MDATAARPLAVVTGASSGIGRELAVQFAEGGFDVLVAAEDDRTVSAARSRSSEQPTGALTTRPSG